MSIGHSNINPPGKVINNWKGRSLFVSYAQRNVKRTYFCATRRNIALLFVLYAWQKVWRPDRCRTRHTISLLFVLYTQQNNVRNKLLMRKRCNSDAQDASSAQVLYVCNKSLMRKICISYTNPLTWRKSRTTYVCMLLQAFSTNQQEIIIIKKWF